MANGYIPAAVERGCDPCSQVNVENKAFLGGVLGIDVNGERQPISEAGIVDLTFIEEETREAAEQAIASAQAAAESEQAASEAAASARSSESAAQTAANAAEAAKDDAEDAASSANASKNTADSYATAAQTAAAQAQIADGNAERSAESAIAAAAQAASSAGSALSCANESYTSASTAQAAADAAQTAQAAAEASEATASTAATTATQAKEAAQSAKNAAEAAQSAAAQSATAASGSATAAAGSATQAAASATAADASATAAAQSAATLTLDATLTSATRAAQAKATGDAIGEVVGDVSGLKTHFDDLVDDTMTVTAYSEQIIPTVTTESGYMGTNGAVTESSSYVHTNAIDVQEGDVIAPVTGGYIMRFVTAFDADGNAVTAKGAGQVYTYAVPAGIKKAVVSYSASYSAMQIAITRTLNNYEVTGLAEVIQSVEEICHANLITGWPSNDVNFYVPTYEAHEMNTNGVIGTSTAYKHSEKIRVSEGDIITIYKDNMTREAFDGHNYAMRFVTAFSGDTAVSASGGNNVGIYTVPQGIDGIVVSVYVSNSSEDHEQQVRIATPITEDFSNAFDVLNGKKYVACGDSFTAAGYDNTDGYPFNYYTFASGRFAGQNRTYPWIIGLRNGMNVVNMAVSGMSMANSTGSNAFVLDDYYKGIPADADYITLKFGINDLNHGAEIGTIDSDDPTSFYGAWNIVMAYITENHPLAKVGIIVTNGLGSANQYADAIIAIAKKWGVPYLDEVYDDKIPLLHRVNRPGVSGTVIQKKLETFRVSPTNTHPNVNAQYYEATFVENWLKSL